MADPPDSLLDWAASAVGEDATVTSVVGLHGGSSPWKLRIESSGASTEAILRTSSDPPRWPDNQMARAKLATGAAALQVAEQHGIAAPRSIARDLSGQHAGLPATLETVLPGESGNASPPTAAGWRDAGAAIARVHSVVLQPQEDIRLDPFLRSAFRDFLFRHVASSRSSPLLLRANELVQRYERPRREAVFLHGDVWPGNLLWRGDSCVGLIDWKEAKVGDPGVELANLRYYAALQYGPDGSGMVRRGWENERAQEAADVAYWDIVWVLYSHDAFDDQSLEASDAGRAFLQAAVDQLE
jgi:aminoglycoside phosphotransferase (APT) family kinase protein